jgi:hypothetical protein
MINKIVGIIKKKSVLVGVQYTPFTLASLKFYKKQLENYLNGDLIGYSFYQNIDDQWDKLYESECNINTNLKYKIHEANKRIGQEIFKSLRSNEDIHKIKIRGIIVGDLIYDTFLNRYSEATVCYKDERLALIIIEALNILNESYNFIKYNNIVALITDQYGFYIYHGILARLCYYNKIKVYTINNFNNYEAGLYPVSFPDSLRGATIDPHWNYKKIFSSLSYEEKELGIKKGLELLNSRILGNSHIGVWGSETAYKSYRSIKDIDQKPSILILLHEFNDAPSCKRWALFTDFYEWAEFTISESLKTGFRVIVKPHPATINLKREIQLMATAKALDKIKSKYPEALYLTGLESNKDLVSLGVVCAFTVHGTVGHELPFLGVPVINAGDNPHIEYTFTYTAKTIEGYKEIIHSCGDLKTHANPNEIGEYIYMRYIRTSNNNLIKPNHKNLITRDLDRHTSDYEAAEILASLMQKVSLV